MDANGAPARAHELLLLDPDPAALTLAQGAGYRLMEQGDLGGLGVGFARLETPAGQSLPDATRALQKLLPQKTVTADQIHFPSGRASTGAAAPAPNALPVGGAVGVIDGGVKPGPRLSAQAGFATGAPRPNDHAQSIASLLAGAGVAKLYAADVYGADPAGGNALAIAKALGWMASQRVGVVSISLVGPSNPCWPAPLPRRRRRACLSWRPLAMMVRHRPCPIRHRIKTWWPLLASTAKGACCSRPGGPAIWIMPPPARI
jgi:hypothetical protein